jgi:hypothetical protein
MNYPAAIQRPGPANKQNGGVNKWQGVVCHSMVGPYAAALGELDNPARRASWHYSVTKDGRVFAHYADEAQTWHAGSAFNNSTIGIEHEGGLNPTGEPLTIPQRDASVALVRWLSATHGFPLVRRTGLWEHNEVSDEPTACPSHRIPWEFYSKQEEDQMKVAPFWTDRRFPVGKFEINCHGDFGASPRGLYDLHVVLAADNAGDVVYSNGDFTVAGSASGKSAAAVVVLRAGRFGTAPFQVVGGAAHFALIAGAPIAE